MSISIFLSIYPSIYKYVYVSVYLSIYISISISRNLIFLLYLDEVAEPGGGNRVEDAVADDNPAEVVGAEGTSDVALQVTTSYTLCSYGVLKNIGFKKIYFCHSLVRQCFTLGPPDGRSVNGRKGRVKKFRYKKHNIQWTT